jgi:hypothetical protein
MGTVSAKETSTRTECCDECGLWFRFVHPSADGRFLCRLCLELEGGNRAWLGTGKRADTTHQPGSRRR